MSFSDPPPFVSPLAAFGDADPSFHCRAAVPGQDGKGERQCVRKARYYRPFSNGEPLPCCGLHAAHYDKALARREEVKERKKLEEQLNARLEALNVPKAVLHYTLTGRPTTSVLVDLDVLEELVRKGQ